MNNEFSNIIKYSVGLFRNNLTKKNLLFMQSNKLAMKN